MRRATSRMLLALVCAALAGCGDDEEKPARERMIEALEKANSSTLSARVQMRVNSAEDGRYSLKGSVTATGDGSRGRMSALFTFRGQAVQMRMITRGKELWVRVPAIDPQLPPGKRWVRTTDPEIVGTTTPSPSVVGDMLKAAGEVEDVGIEQVEGVRARHLRAILDIDDLARQSGGSSKSDAFRRLVAANNASVTTGIWIGPDGRPLRYRANARIPRPGGGAPQTAFLDIFVDDYDVEVDASPPPEALVTDDSVLD